MIQDLGVLEMLDKVFEALEAGIGEVAYLRQSGLTFSLLNLPHRLL